MTTGALAAVLFSSFLHALWNLFNKGSADRWAFFLGQGTVAAVCYAPLALWLMVSQPFAATSWLWMALSVATHAGYAVYLLRAYDAGDLSVAYPLSRTAPVLLAAWDALVVGEPVTAAGVAGALLAGGGAVVLQWPSIRAQGLRAVLRAPVTRYALLTALFVALFTVVDKQGVSLLHPLVFLYFVSLGETCVIAFLLRREAPTRLRNEWQRNAWRMAATGMLGGFSYLLILWALASAPASYVLGLRQCSIVFGVVLAHFVLRELETRYRLAGASVIAFGSALIALYG
ncbi:MAG: EamA family transporter [Candidatus Binatia bacterium]|nr:EamA family transporter [Candidatus Binatia bacterium]